MVSRYSATITEIIIGAIAASGAKSGHVIRWTGWHDGGVR